MFSLLIQLRWKLLSVEYEAFTNSQSSTRKPKDDYVIRAVHQEDHKIKHENKVEKSEELKNADLTEFVKTFSECMGKVTEKLDKIDKPVKYQNQDQSLDRAGFRKSVECWNCGRKCHISRFCQKDRYPDDFQNKSYQSPHGPSETFEKN
jgi:hypothetical protein